MLQIYSNLSFLTPTAEAFLTGYMKIISNNNDNLISDRKKPK